MHEPPEHDGLTYEFRRERSIRRAMMVLEAKRKRIQEDLESLTGHLKFLVPTAGNQTQDSCPDVIEEALGRMEDDAFAQLMLQLLHKS